MTTTDQLIGLSRAPLPKQVLVAAVKAMGLVISGNTVLDRQQKEVAFILGGSPANLIPVKHPVRSTRRVICSSARKCA